MWTRIQNFAKWVKRIFNPRKVMKEVLSSMDFECADNLYCISVTTGEKAFKLVMEKDSSLGTSYDAIATMAKYVADLIQKHQESLQPSSPAPEESKE